MKSEKKPGSPEPNGSSDTGGQATQSPTPSTGVTGLHPTTVTVRTVCRNCGKEIDAVPPLHVVGVFCSSKCWDDWDFDNYYWSNRDGIND